ncbi:MAG: hypothetical protein IEMM0008_1703 [bacterium]|nr:MAG: hypothetical protein IEMM0008_1703 [bacterium]
MKVNLHPMFTALSGSLGKIVYTTLGKEMVDGEVIRDSATYAKQKGVRTAPLSIVQDNIQLAFTILIAKFNALKLDTSAYQTWRDEADILEQSLRRYTTAYQLFLSYYMTAYVSTLGTFVQPADLSAGASLTWTDRASRIWS